MDVALRSARCSDHVHQRVEFLLFSFLLAFVSIRLALSLAHKAAVALLKEAFHERPQVIKQYRIRRRGEVRR